MTNYDKEALEALREAIKAGEACYFAFNKVAVKTQVNFRFYGTDLYDAINLCKLWAEALAKKEGE